MGMHACLTGMSVLEPQIDIINDFSEIEFSEAELYISASGRYPREICTLHGIRYLRSVCANLWHVLARICFTWFSAGTGNRCSLGICTWLGKNHFMNPLESRAVADAIETGQMCRCGNECL